MSLIARNPQAATKLSLRQQLAQRVAEKCKQQLRLQQQLQQATTPTIGDFGSDEPGLYFDLNKSNLYNAQVMRNRQKKYGPFHWRYPMHPPTYTPPKLLDLPAPLPPPPPSEPNVLFDLPAPLPLPPSSAQTTMTTTPHASHLKRKREQQSSNGDGLGALADSCVFALVKRAMEARKLKNKKARKQRTCEVDDRDYVPEDTEIDSEEDYIIVVGKESSEEDEDEECIDEDEWECEAEKETLRSYGKSRTRKGCDCIGHTEMIECLACPAVGCTKCTWIEYNKKMMMSPMQVL